jgi:hypothetical protein
MDEAYGVICLMCGRDLGCAPRASTSREGATPDSNDAVGACAAAIVTVASCSSPIRRCDRLATGSPN